MACSGQQTLLIYDKEEVRQKAILRFVYITSNRAGKGRKNFLTILKEFLSTCNQNKTKTVAPQITHLMCS